MERKTTQFFRIVFKVIRNLLIAAVATAIVEQILFWICNLGMQAIDSSAVNGTKDLMEAISGHNDIMQWIISIPYALKFMFGYVVTPLAYIGMVAAPFGALYLALDLACDD